MVISIALFSDRSIDERMVLDNGLICVQNKYSKYDEISVNDYEIFDVEEKDGKKIVKLEMNITAKKDGKEEKKKESFYVGYNKETAEYTFENYEYTGSY